MVKDLEWKSLQERRLTARLSLLYKASHHLASIDLSNFYINPEGSRQTRQTSALSFRRPQPNKNCYKYSFLPRTIAQWNSLPSNIRESPTIEILKSRTQNSNLLQMTRGGPFRLLSCFAPWLRPVRDIQSIGVCTVANRYRYLKSHGI